jgi:hypothetical protein
MDRSIQDNEQGTAALTALLLMLLLGAVAAALNTLTTTETLISASHRHVQETSYGADAALERALFDLALLPDWSSIVAPPPGNVVSSFHDGTDTPQGPDGRRLNLPNLSAARQRESDERDGRAVFGADSPEWRLFAHAPIHTLVPSAPTGPPVYLAVWVADDGGDGDGDPSRDTNQRVIVYAEAFGTGGARRAVEATVSRAPDGTLRLVSWHGLR